jgi:NAD(P)H-dependent FMN reductase
MDFLAGLVLISPVLDEAESPASSLADGAKFALGNMPVLLISHSADTCSATATKQLQDIAGGLKAKNFQAISVSAGSDRYQLKDPLAYPGDACNKKAQHVLAGLEERVSAAIVEWLAKQLSERP